MLLKHTHWAPEHEGASRMLHIMTKKKRTRQLASHEVKATTLAAKPQERVIAMTLLALWTKAFGISPA